MKRLSLVILFLALMFGATQAGHADEIPTWKGVTKTAAQKQADKTFIEAVRKKTDGDLNVGAQRAIMLGWQFIAKGDVENAIRRFNQAWLLKPDRGDVYWGFAVATGNRGDPIQDVEGWFSLAEEIIGPEHRLYSDWGRTLEQRGEADQAIPVFLMAIDLNGENPEPHIGLVRAYLAIGDKTGAEKHMRILDGLKK